MSGAHPVPFLVYRTSEASTLALEGRKYSVFVHFFIRGGRPTVFYNVVSSPSPEAGKRRTKEMVVAELGLIFVVPALILAFPALHRADTGPRKLLHLLVASAKVSLLIVIPFFYMAMNGLGGPYSKAEAQNGWLDCYGAAMPAMLPLFIWASIAIWAVEVPPRQRPTRSPFVSLGLVVGIMYHGTIAVIHAMTQTTSGFNGGDFLVMSTTFAFVPVWFLCRFILEFPRQVAPVWSYFLTILGSMPLWWWGLYRAKTKYAQLPETSPDCFIVSAASHGHKMMVNSYTCPITGRITNDQLHRFRVFERLWKKGFPTSHATFRIFYNAIGPCMASRLRHPIAADITYFALSRHSRKIKDRKSKIKQIIPLMSDK